MKAKSRGRKARTGCLICNLRHVKCDEERPNCRRCVESGRQCLGYPDEAQADRAKRVQQVRKTSNAPAPSRQKPAAATARRSAAVAVAGPVVAATPSPTATAVGAHPQWAAPELRSFQFSLERTIPNITTYFEWGLWTHTIPQMAQREPAVRFALSALAAEHESTELRFWRTTAPPPRSPRLGQDHADAASSLDGEASWGQEVALRNFSLQQYNRAIARLKDLMTRRRPRSSSSSPPSAVGGGPPGSSADDAAALEATRTTLVCCLLFTCIESMKGHDDTTLEHFRSGLRVYHGWLRRAATTAAHDGGRTRARILDRSTLDGTIFHIFRRLDHHATTFIDGHVPLLAPIFDTPPSSPSVDGSLMLANLEEARSRFDSLLGSLFYFLAAHAPHAALPADRLPAAARQSHAALGAALAAYETALEHFLQQYEAQLPCANDVGEVAARRARRGATLLRLRAIVARVFHRKWPDPQEAREPCEPEFERILAHAAELIETSRPTPRALAPAQTHARPDPALGVVPRAALEAAPAPPSSASAPPSARAPPHSKSASPPLRSTSAAARRPPAAAPPTAPPRPTNTPTPSPAAPSPHPQAALAPAPAAPIFTLESGLVPFLFYAAHAAPLRAQRERAVALLLAARVREGLWCSTLAGNLARRRLQEVGGARRPLYGTQLQHEGGRIWREWR